MKVKNSLIYVLTFLISFLSSHSISQDMEFPEDKVHYTIKSEQSECEVTIFAEIEIEDTIYEPEFHHVYDEIAKEDLYLHNGKITISKKIFIQTQDDFNLKGFFTFQTCDDNHCLPPYDGEFEVKINGCDYQNHTPPSSSKEKEGQSEAFVDTKEKIGSKNEMANTTRRTKKNILK